MHQRTSDGEIGAHISRGKRGTEEGPRSPLQLSARFLSAPLLSSPLLSSLLHVPPRLEKRKPFVPPSIVSQISLLQLPPLFPANSCRPNLSAARPAPCKAPTDEQGSTPQSDHEGGKARRRNRPRALMLEADSQRHQQPQIKAREDGRDSDSNWITSPLQANICRYATLHTSPRHEDVLSLLFPYLTTIRCLDLSPFCPDTMLPVLVYPSCPWWVWTPGSVRNSPSSPSFITSPTCMFSLPVKWV